MAEDFPNVTKIFNLHIRAVPWIPSRRNIKRSTRTHHGQTVKSQKPENLENGKEKQLIIYRETHSKINRWLLPLNNGNQKAVEYSIQKAKRKTTKKSIFSVRQKCDMGTPAVYTSHMCVGEAYEYDGGHFHD